MSCPKCGSERIAFAPDEAPAWAKKWTKCFACGKRWNLDGGPPKTIDNPEEVAVETPAPCKRTGDDLVALVMKVARSSAATQSPAMESVSIQAHARRPHTMSPEARAKISAAQRRRHAKAGHKMTEEDSAMSTDRRCKEIVRTGTRCASPASKGTALCQRHLEKQGGAPPVVSVPAKRRSAITLADPTIVTARPVRGMDLNGNVATIIAGAVERRRHEIAVLEEAQEILTQ